MVREDLTEVNLPTVEEIIDHFENLIKVMSFFEDIVKKELTQKVDIYANKKVYPNHSTLGPTELKILTDETNLEFNENYIVPLKDSKSSICEIMEQMGAEYSRYLLRRKFCLNSITKLSDEEIQSTFNTKFRVIKEGKK